MHPAIEMLTHPRGGAIQIVRFCSGAIFEEFSRRHLFRRRSGAWASLELAYLKHEDAQEEVLVVFGAEPELHIHGGEANFEALISKLKQLPIAEGPDVDDAARRWRQLWEETFREIRGEKALAYMLELLKCKNTSQVPKMADLDFDQEGWEFLRPIKVSIVGPPNAGKSTFFNELLGENRALVSHLAGTTRDLMQASVILGGFEVHLTDTAGFDPEHDSFDNALDPKKISPELHLAPDSDITGQSVRLAYECLRQSDLVLAFRCHISAKVVEPAKVLLVYSKCEDGGAQADQWAISVHQNRGINLLMDELQARILKLKGQRISPHFHKRLLDESFKAGPKINP